MMMMMMTIIIIIIIIIIIMTMRLTQRIINPTRSTTQPYRGMEATLHAS